MKESEDSDCKDESGFEGDELRGLADEEELAEEELAEEEFAEEISLSWELSVARL